MDKLDYGYAASVGFIIAVIALSVTITAILQLFVWDSPPHLTMHLYLFGMGTGFSFILLNIRKLDYITLILGLIFGVVTLNLLSAVTRGIPLDNLYNIGLYFGLPIVQASVVVVASYAMLLQIFKRVI